MRRRAKILIAITATLVLGVMIFAATTRRALHGGVLAPINRMVARERAAVLEDSTTHNLFFVRVIQIDNASPKEIIDKLEPSLKADGYQSWILTGDERLYAKNYASPPAPGVGVTPTVFVSLRKDVAVPKAVYVSDIHTASSFEAMCARALALGRKLKPMGGLNTSPVDFMMTGEWDHSSRDFLDGK